MSAKSLQQAYQVRVNELSRELTRLGKEAEEIKARNDAAATARQEIHALKQKVAYLESQREELKEEFADASFDQDQDAIADVVAKRDSIDADVKQLENEIQQQQKTIQDNKVDLHISTALAVELALLSTPDVFTYIKQLQQMLWAEADELKNKKQTARMKLQTDPSLFDDLMHEARPGHKSSAQRQQDKLDREQREYELWNSSTKGGTISL